LTVAVASRASIRASVNWVWARKRADLENHKG
jgi:hypothetical protein